MLEFFSGSPLVIFEMSKKCLQLNASFSLFVTSLRLHMFEKHGDDEVKCQECPMKFNHPVALERHVALRHTNTICPECGEEVGVARLKTHMRSKHTLESQKVKVTSYQAR